MAKRIVRIVFEVLSLLILLGTVVFLALYWKNIPAQVPNHWNGSGKITGWLSKNLLFLFPALMAAVFVSLFFAKTVQLRSLGKTIRVAAPELLFPAMTLTLISGLAYLTVCSALVRPLGAWFFPVFLVLLFLPMLIFSVTVRIKRQ